MNPNPAATKPAKGKPTRKDYVGRFAEAVTRFSSQETEGNVLGQIFRRNFPDLCA